MRTATAQAYKLAGPSFCMHMCNANKQANTLKKKQNGSMTQVKLTCNPPLGAEPPAKDHCRVASLESIILISLLKP